MKRKILFVTGSRGEYGYIRPIIKLLQNQGELDYGIVVTDMHLLSTFGSSIKEIQYDQFKIEGVIYNTLDGYNQITVAKSLGIFLLQFPEILDKSKSDLLVVAGDRGVQLMATIAASNMSLPVAHIQAGELSGHIDNYTRHAIARFTHLHFAANRECKNRLISSGEQEFRIFTTGAPQLDELFDDSYVTTKDEIKFKYGITEDQPFFLVVFHPSVEELNLMDNQIGNILEAIDYFKFKTIFIMNNSDAGSQHIRDHLLSYRKEYVQIFKNVVRNDYLGLLRMASVLIGNSSSGIIEAPLYSLPVVNLGARQKDRERGLNVIDTGSSVQEILSGIKKANDSDFRSRQKPLSPYGDGKASQRILDILSNIDIDERLLRKEFFV